MYGKVLLQNRNKIPGVDVELPKATSKGKLCFSELEVNYDRLE